VIQRLIHQVPFHRFGQILGDNYTNKSGNKSDNRRGDMSVSAFVMLASSQILWGLHVLPLLCLLPLSTKMHGWQQCSKRLTRRAAVAAAAAGVTARLDIIRRIAVVVVVVVVVEIVYLHLVEENCRTVQ
jgi:uncharacterized membrane protein